MSNSIKNKLTFIDLFCGAGGLSKGLELAGLRCVGSLDFSQAVCRTHEHNFPNSVCVETDISKMSPRNFEKKIKRKRVDFIVGGPPCPTFSTVGGPKINSLLKGGASTLFDDRRNFLFRDFFKYIQHFNPKGFLMENVPNFMTKYDGKIFRQTIDRVRELGYCITGERVLVLNSANYGVPQKRKRMFLIGHKKGYRFDYPKITHDDRGENLFKDAKNFVDVRSAISDLPKITDNPNKIDKMEYSKFKGLSPFQILMRKNNRSTMVRNNVCRLTNERAIKVFSHMKQGSKYDDLPKRVKDILGYRDDIFKDRLKRLSYSEPSWTVVAHLGMDGYMFIHPDEPRTISVREAARLQSFPDDFVFIGNLSETYHMVGNAVPVLMAQKLGKELMKMLKKQRA